jgi:hypothetical protein
MRTRYLLGLVLAKARTHSHRLVLLYVAVAAIGGNNIGWE